MRELVLIHCVLICSRSSHVPVEFARSWFGCGVSAVFCQLEMVFFQKKNSPVFNFEALTASDESVASSFCRRGNDSRDSELWLEILHALVEAHNCERARVCVLVFYE